MNRNDSFARQEGTSPLFLIGKFPSFWGGGMGLVQVLFVFFECTVSDIGWILLS